MRFTFKEADDELTGARVRIGRMLIESRLSDGKASFDVELL
jgi:hypothetical protein